MFAVAALLCGCLPLPRTLWFKSTPPDKDGTVTFRLEQSEASYAHQDLSETEIDMIEMAAFWSRSKGVCPSGVVPIAFGKDSDKKRYWLTGRCAAVTDAPTPNVKG